MAEPGTGGDQASGARSQDQTGVLKFTAQSNFVGGTLYLTYIKSICLFKTF